MGSLSAFFLYAAVLIPIWLAYVYLSRRKSRRARQAHADALEAGLTEPVSLHPVIDAARCLGCGACVSACPEQPEHHVLGLIDGKARLVSPTDCIGHGACKIACPTGAISLVFGTETRGVTIPLLSPHFETSVAGIYVAGELGGMGLIRNALTQGCQAVDAIASALRTGGRGERGCHDVVIVGAGPAGLAASIAAKAAKLDYVTLEQESLGGCVFQYPRGKLVMTSPARLPIVGEVRFRHTSKEELLRFWQQTEKSLDLRIRYQQRVVTIERSPSGTFLVRTPRGALETRFVLLAIGRRGTPRKLGVAGEDLSKVVYRLIDAEQYRGQHVLVVGGGDSALEAAASVAEAGAASATLSYRGEAFQRAKAKNRARVQAAAASGRLKVLLSSNVRQIQSEAVTVEQQGRSLQLRNDAVIIAAGGILPNDFLHSIGITVETKYGTA